MQTTIALIATTVALIALIIQIREIKRNSKLQALIYAASKIETEIQHHSEVIASLKKQKKDTIGHEVNNKKRKDRIKAINEELSKMYTAYTGLSLEKMTYIKNNHESIHSQTPII